MNELNNFSTFGSFFLNLFGNRRKSKMQPSHEKLTKNEYKYKSVDFNNNLEANLGQLHESLLQIHMKFTIVKLIAESGHGQTNLTTKCEKTNQQN